MVLWSTTLRIDRELKLLVTSQEGDLIKARLPLRPSHPRALLTMLEGIALFSGEPIYAAISARRRRDDWLESQRWDDELWPAESALVHFQFTPSPARVRYLRGVGDFRDVRRHLRLVWSR